MKKVTALLLSLLFLWTAAAAELSFTVRYGDRSQKRICITVDDCSNIEMLEAIFNLGQELDIPITFFTLGYVLKEEDRDLWRAIAESDCEIGNHTYYHKSLPQMSHNAIVKTLQNVQDRLDEVLGYHYPMQVVRPPYGNMRIGDGSNMPVVNALRAAGYTHAVLWDVSQTNPDKCIKDVKNGSILLFHTITKDYACLQNLLPRLQEEGYTFVTVSEMLGMEPVVIERTQEE